MDNYEIRLANLNDLPEVKEIELEAAHRFDGSGLLDAITDADQNVCTFDPDKLRELTAKQQVWVVCLDNKTVGFAICSIFGNRVFLEEIDVMMAHGRRGLATRLIRTACSWAKEKGLVAMDLATFEEVPWNAPFYKKLGFEILPRHQWTPEIIEQWQHEEKSGLPMDKRVVMRLDFAPT